MTSSWKACLPFFLRLAFILPVVTVVSIHIVASWPLWEEDFSKRSVMQHDVLNPCLQVAARIEHERAYSSQKKVGLLTYVKRNYKRWRQGYKIKKTMKKLKSLSADSVRK